MTSNTIVSEATRPHQLTSKAFVTTGRAASLIGCCINHVKALCEADELEHFRTSGGHVRVRVPSLLSYVYGVDESDQQAELSASGGVALYVRVSSSKQEKAGSRERQLERLQAEATKRGFDNPKVYSETASAFGNREVMNKLIDSIIDGETKVIICEYMDRVSRVPALTHLILHICKRYGCEIICIDKEETNPDELDTMMRELCDYVCILSNRLAAQKSKKVTVKTVESETVKRLFELRAQGHSITAIWKKAKTEGLSNDRGEPLSYYKCQQLLEENASAMGAVIGEEVGQTGQEVVEDFVVGRLTPADKPARLFASEIREAYEDYCKSRCVQPLPFSEVGRCLKKHFNGARYKTLGQVAYRLAWN